MPRLRTVRSLPPGVAGRISNASYVRSFSQAVVELVSNAIDAEATEIEVRCDWRDQSVTVSDNGCGISVEDFDKLGVTHCTSKGPSLAAAFGFRGVALYALSHVAHLRVATRAKGEAETSSKEVANGRVVSTARSRSQGSRPGTSVSVREFLWRFPVRRRLAQRTPSSKGLQEIREKLLRLLLPFPRVALSLRSDPEKTLLLELQKDRDLASVLSELFAELAESLVPVDFCRGSVRVCGHVAMLGVQNALQSTQFLYVNRRAVAGGRVRDAIRRVHTAACRCVRGNVQMSMYRPAWLLNIELGVELFSVGAGPETATVIFADVEHVTAVVTSALFVAWKAKLSEDAVAKLAEKMCPERGTDESGDLLNSGKGALLRLEDVEANRSQQKKRKRATVPPMLRSLAAVRQCLSIAENQWKVGPADGNHDSSSSVQVSDSRVCASETAGYSLSLASSCHIKSESIEGASGLDDELARSQSCAVEDAATAVVGEWPAGPDPADEPCTEGSTDWEESPRRDALPPSPCTPDPPRRGKGTAQTDQESPNHSAKMLSAPPLRRPPRRNVHRNPEISLKSRSLMPPSSVRDRIPARTPGLEVRQLPATLPAKEPTPRILSTPPVRRKPIHGRVITINTTAGGWSSVQPGVTDLSHKTTTASHISRSVLENPEIIGCVDKKFILVRKGTHIYAVDQHAADERVRLEQYEAQIREELGSGALRVRVKSPISIQLTHWEQEVFMEYREVVAQWGWAGALNTGRRLLHLSHHPSILNAHFSATDLKVFLHALDATAGGVTRPPCVSRLVKSRACRTALKFGDDVTASRQCDVLQALLGTHFFFQCAHGRPTISPLLDLQQL